MDIQLEHTLQQNLITAYDKTSISVNHQMYNQAIVVSSQQVLLDWCEVNFEQLTQLHFERLLVLKPEVIILGTGQQHRFIHPKHTQILSTERIAVECMTTAAACRTYNILVAEGRSVVAALLFE